MLPQQASRINLGELKVQIVKRIGTEKSKRYFYILSRFLSDKYSKSEFDKSCCRLLGRENLPLHNQLIVSILRNASEAKTPPLKNEADPAKYVTRGIKASPCREDGLEQGGSPVLHQNQNASVWSNGIFPASPRKSRSTLRDRKHWDRPSPLGPNGKVECLSHQAMDVEEIGAKFNLENGTLTPCEGQRSIQHLQPVAEQRENLREELGRGTLSKSQVGRTIAQDKKEAGLVNDLNRCKAPLLAPLGITLYPTSSGGARKAACYESGGLPDSEALRKRMEQIAVEHGLGGVSIECANMLNNMLDVFLRKLIRSCVELVGTRTILAAQKYTGNQQQSQNKVLNGIWPNNNLHMQSSSRSIGSHEQRQQQCLISLLDFRVAMELNPQQLGEDWPLLLERICMRSFEE